MRVYEDDPGMRRLYWRLLDLHGHELVGADEPADAAIVDLHLAHGQSGLDVIRALRVEDPQMRVIAVSGMIGCNGLEAEAESAGAHVCLGKDWGALLEDLPAALVAR